ncbi:hypothetical protein CBM2586_B20028 [Cupriavidus phytorum]|uniref:Uncharacterized protein n=1 Tax=Cupriavidus taiwanensis TaxID=164546 RepID=A0A375CKE4_9BURK|nr:hypothetical protein CBM2586_B20028 [Cupriavidus taiwanensis]
MVCLNHTPPSGDSNDPKGLKHPFETTRHAPDRSLLKSMRAGVNRPAAWPCRHFSRAARWNKKMRCDGVMSDSAP